MNGEDMGTTALKSSLHEMLERMENEQLLRSIYDLLLEQEQAKEGQIWKTLTEEQRIEVNASYQESDDEENLVSWKDVKQKHE